MLNLVPTEQDKQKAVDGFIDDLKSYQTEIENNGEREMKPVICAVCDGIAKSPKWASWVKIPSEFEDLCQKSNLGKERLRNIYGEHLLQQYTATHEYLKQYILSPDSIISNDKILVCNNCLAHMRKQTNNRKAIKYHKPPKESIANGYVIGHAPEELRCLNEVELTLISRVKIHSYIWIYFAGCHKQIRGWHTFYKNRPVQNLASIQTLQNAGIKGNILVVLCGPFTTTQKAIAMEETQIRPHKVIAAFKWLKKNNYHYRDDDIPDVNDLPHVEVIFENV